jgi:hypothetical protein
VAATRAVQSRENDPSRAITTSAPSGISTVGSAHACQGPIGQLGVLHGHPLAEALAAERSLSHLRGQGGSEASRWGKSSRAGLATFHACSSSREQPAGAAYARK